MISETHLRLEVERNIAYQSLHSNVKSKPMVHIDLQNQLAIENVCVWEIDDGTNITYRISTPGLAQNNYNDRVMIRGKQTERHVLGQYGEDATMNMYPLRDYLSLEEVELYMQLVSSNNIRGCVEYLRIIEGMLNLRVEEEIKELIKVPVRLVKKGN